MLGEFKKFIARGNVIDLAVAVVIGAAFGKIVDSLVKDIIMPPIGMLLARVDFTEMYLNLGREEYESLAAAQAAGAATINYGVFINNLVSFFIVAFVIFLIVRQLNRFKKPTSQPAEPTDKKCPHCVMMIPVSATRCPHCTSAIA